MKVAMHMHAKVDVTAPEWTKYGDPKRVEEVLTELGNRYMRRYLEAEFAMDWFKLDEFATIVEELK